VAAFASISGFLAGFLRPGWQSGVETAQALAGLVSYPPGNPVYMYDVKLWTIVNQIAVVLFHFGLSERQVSVLVSAVNGGVAFLALALCTFAVSENLWLALAMPFAINSSPVIFDVSYTPSLAAGQNTAGLYGLSMVLLTLSLMSLRRHRAAGFALGIMPAVHPALGIWCWVIALISMFWDRDYREKSVPQMWKAALIGLAVSFLSFCVQLSWMIPVLPRLDAGTRNNFIQTWVRYIDTHRQPVDLSLAGVKLTIFGLVFVFLLMQRSTFSIETRLMLRVFVTSALLAMAAAIISWIPAQYMWPPLLTLMPMRVFALVTVLFIPMLFGVLYRFGSFWVHLNRSMLAGLLSIPLLLYNLKKACTVAACPAGLLAFLNSATSLLTPDAYILACLTLSMLGLLLWRYATTQKHEPESVRYSRPLSAGMATIMIAAVLQAEARLWIGSHQASAGLTDRTNNAVLAAVAREPGLILTTPLDLVQLRTRKPLVIDPGGLDSIPYVPESGPALNQILRKVYAVDLLDPPQVIKDHPYEADVMRATKPVWEQRSTQEWKYLASEFGFNIILTDPTWNLHLPRADSDDEFVLYRVPK
jgi:hypothetical protein